MNGGKPSRTEQKLPDEALGALASQYVEAMEPSAGGEPKRQEAREIARRIEEAFAPDGISVAVDRRLEAAREAAQLLQEGGRAAGAIEAALRLAFTPEQQWKPAVQPSGNWREDPLPRKVIWRTGGEGGRILARGPMRSPGRCRQGGKKLAGGIAGYCSRAGQA